MEQGYMNTSQMSIVLYTQATNLLKCHVNWLSLEAVLNYPQYLLQRKGAYPLIKPTHW